MIEILAVLAIFGLAWLIWFGLATWFLNSLVQALKKQDEENFFE